MKYLFSTISELKKISMLKDKNFLQKGHKSEFVGEKAISGNSGAAFLVEARRTMLCRMCKRLLGL